MVCGVTTLYDLQRRHNVSLRLLKLFIRLEISLWTSTLDITRIETGRSKVLAQLWTASGIRVGKRRVGLMQRLIIFILLPEREARN